MCKNMHKKDILYSLILPLLGNIFKCNFFLYTKYLSYQLLTKCMEIEELFVMPFFRTLKKEKEKKNVKRHLICFLKLKIKPLF